jgi:hypothetical protein
LLQQLQPIGQRIDLQPRRNFVDEGLNGEFVRTGADAAHRVDANPGVDRNMLHEPRRQVIGMQQR